MPSTGKVENTEENLRDLLTSIYVAVIGYVPAKLKGMSRHPAPNYVDEAAWDSLATTVLDAAEGRAFTPLELPWPPTKAD